MAEEKVKRDWLRLPDSNREWIIFIVSTILLAWLCRSLAGWLGIRLPSEITLFGGTLHLPHPLRLRLFFCFVGGVIAGRVISRMYEQREKLPPPAVEIAKLPSSGPHLFGRDKELGILDAAWANSQTNVITVVASGGIGKSALVNRWLNDRMRPRTYRGARRVYGWSFYSQGTKEDTQASSDSFIDSTLRWYGYEPKENESQWDKGRRLAELVRQQKTLLILDGLEPLQNSSGQDCRALRDNAIQVLIRDLAADNQGLCIITTRYRIQDLDSYLEPQCLTIDLDSLSDAAGAHLLESVGVISAEKDMENASQDFGGHALALTLLGPYVATDGNVRRRDLIPDLIVEEGQGGQAFRVMRSYETWLKGKPELDVLNLLGLFDRPAEGGAIDALRKAPVIEGLTDTLVGLPEMEWQKAIKHLRDLRLLDAKEEACPDTLDCHPLVREHFGAMLKAKNPAAWKEAHSRLYEYYKALPVKELPDTLEEMEPLYRAVAHGCHAGRHQEALEKVYWLRISRHGGFYSTTQLGALGADLAALSGFFEVLWSQPAAGLPDNAKAGVLNWAGFGLRAVGRLREARGPMQAGLEMDVQREDWTNAAIAAGNLSELSLTLGEVSEAVAYARQSVEFAGRSGNEFQIYSKCTTVADALHQAGELPDAENLFREAENLQKKDHPEHPFLYSLPGYRFCDLLLSQGEFRQMRQRASQTLKWLTEQNWLLDIALDNLSLGRAALMQAGDEGRSAGSAPSTATLREARTYLDTAVQGLREAGAQEFIVRGLLARAEYHRTMKDCKAAWHDLEEAREIAERGEMRLFIADYHLEAARLSLAEKKTDQARDHFTIAKKMVEEMGYGRRTPEVQELERQLGVGN